MTEIEEKLAALGLTLGMLLEEDAHRAVIAATVAGTIATAK